MTELVESRSIAFETATASALKRDLADYAEMLAQAVAQGASIGFVQPFESADAARFWTDRVLPMVESGASVLLCARSEGRVVGTVQLLLPIMPNQRHKADVSKMMVHPAHRRGGIGQALLHRLILEARSRGFQLLTLDTRTGDDAQRLYAAAGFEVAGVIPGFAADPADPDKLDGTTYMFKWL